MLASLFTQGLQIGKQFPAGHHKVVQEKLYTLPPSLAFAGNQGWALREAAQVASLSPLSVLASWPGLNMLKKQKPAPPCPGLALLL